MIKKFTAILAAAFLSVTLSACSGENNGIPENVGGTENPTVVPHLIGEKQTNQAGESFEIRENGEYEYEVYSDYIVLTSYLQNETVVEVPKEIDGVRVTELSGTFNKKSITSVSIPDGVVKIGKMAFFCCGSLEEVFLPDSILTVGDNAFERCENLKNISIPDGVTEIGKSAFYLCSSLESLTLPSSLEKINDEAFYCCRALTKIIIPDSVKEIGQSAFKSCDSLAEISVPENTYVGDSAFSHTAWIDDQNQPVIINGNLLLWDTAEGDISIPDDVKIIGSWAFWDCESIKSISLPSSVETIKSFAFSECESLAEIIIPDSISEIESDAFEGCINLKNVVISDKFDHDQLKEAFKDTPWYKKFCDGTYIGPMENDEYEYDVYEKHIVLTQYLKDDEYVVIPAEIDGLKVTEISESVFIHCDEMTKVTIPYGITKIGNRAFCNTKLTELTIPDSVTILDDCAFMSCENLISINIPDSVTEIGEYAFERSGLKEITIPDSITVLNEYVFDECENLTQINIPNSVTKIGKCAFARSGLTEIAIPDSVTVLENDAFWNCTSLTKVTVPEHFDEETIKAAFGNTPWYEENYGE